ncbi:LacI family DNA-binding transcriptional regulator [Alteromonas sp. 14N.309.X.WAT.G.H12]|uniref:LacI family DNA-binding transcriptional regulator n=1 Tax=Alteromonas sp. 14N.309.X.WAT.G.H12 TaxID=3120824 RepID=UPI002FD41E66
MTTIYQVAEHAGVSLSTVSRVLNGRKTVNPKLREKVELAMQELNYRPSSVARSLATNRTDSIGILVSELDTPFFGEMVQAIEVTLRQANKHVIITVGHNDLAQEVDAVEFLISRRCDALIMHTEGMSDEQLAAINQDRIPIAVINRDVPGIDDGCFCLDNEQGGFLATEHLIAMGHRQIGYISGPRNKHDAMERLSGHKRALAEGGLDFLPEMVFEGHFQELDGRDGLRYLKQQNPALTAVVCANDWMASGAMSCARDMGLDLPRDLSIVGFDNLMFAHHVFPKLTTVSNPVNKMGEMAAKSILNRVYDQQHVLQPLYDAQLVVRDSVFDLNSL